MATRTTVAEAAVVMTPQEREALLEEQPMLVSRLMRMVLGALEARNPLLEPQLDRMKRRLLALSRLEFRALRAALWAEHQDFTLDQMRIKVEGYAEDPTLLISKLDGHLTWIENASAEEIAREARGLPEVIVKMERVADLAEHLAGHGAHPHCDGAHGGEHRHVGVAGETGGIAQIRRLMIAAFFETIASQEPSLADRLDRVKRRLLALSPVRRRALAAAYWQVKRDKPLSIIKAKLESWFEHPADRLTHLEQRLDTVEGLSSQAVEEQAAQLPISFAACEETISAPASA